MVDAILGAGGTLLAGLIVFFVTSIARLWHTPKRLDRLEKIMPVTLRALLAVLSCQKRGVSNGETDAAIEEINQLLTNGAVSQKETR